MTTVGLASPSLSRLAHHEHIAMKTEKKLINIELDVLLEKFAELTKRVHQLDLERIEWRRMLTLSLTSRASRNFPARETDQRVTESIGGKQHQTRDEVHELSHRLPKFTAKMKATKRRKRIPRQKHSRRNPPPTSGN